MFNDRQKALEALEEELLLEAELEEAQQPQEETWDEQTLYRNYSNNYGRVNAYNRDVEDADLEDYVEQVRTGGKGGQGLTVLLTAVLALLCVALAVMAVRYR